MKYIIKRSDDDYVVHADRYGQGGYNVVPRSLDPHNVYTIGEVEAYLEEHPEHLLDKDAIDLEHKQAQARRQRDSLILSIRWRIERHQDELTLGLEPSEPIEPVLAYIQALRDVPQQEGFPEDVEWPVLPKEIKNED